MHKRRVRFKLQGKMGKDLQEIERKFLVRSEDYKRDSFQTEKIVQGFLSRHPERTVRVRIKGEQGFLTIKGKSPDGGVSRFEWEKEISLEEAGALFRLCEPGKIEKVRHLVKQGSHMFEVDEFHGENEGLTVAEIELSDVNEEFGKPKWLGEEVTGDNRYYNSQLSRFPYSGWEE